MTLYPEQNENKALGELENALKGASALPYNNASHVLNAAGEKPDLRFGGSCLDKLACLRDLMPENLKSGMRVVTSGVRGSITHYAIVVDVEERTFYLDPFLWQEELMEIGENARIEGHAKTLEDIWTLQREPDEPGAIFVVSFCEGVGAESKILVTHKFVSKLDNLPSSSALPLKPDLPSFMMQIPDSENQKFYKLWYIKSNEHLSDIWIADGKTGARRKVTNKVSDEDLRRATVSEIEALLGCSESELCNFFARAAHLEKEIKPLIDDSTNDVPGGQHENI